MGPGIANGEALSLGLIEGFLGAGDMGAQINSVDGAAGLGHGQGLAHGHGAANGRAGRTLFGLVHTRAHALQKSHGPGGTSVRRTHDTSTGSQHGFHTQAGDNVRDDAVSQEIKTTRVKGRAARGQDNGCGPNLFRTLLPGLEQDSAQIAGRTRYGFQPTAKADREARMGRNRLGQFGYKRLDRLSGLDEGGKMGRVAAKARSGLNEQHRLPGYGQIKGGTQAGQTAAGNKHRELVPGVH